MGTSIRLNRIMNINLGNLYQNEIVLSVNKLHYLGNVNFKHIYISNKPCHCRSTDYWEVDIYPRTNSPSSEVSNQC